MKGNLRKMITEVTTLGLYSSFKSGIKPITIFTLQRSPLRVEKVLSEDIYFMENN